MKRTIFESIQEYFRGNTKRKTILILILNIIFPFIIYIQGRTHFGITANIFVFIIIAILVVLSIMLLRRIYFHETKTYKDKLFLASVITITLLNGLITQFAQVAYRHGLIYKNELIMPSISDAYYFSIVTFTTLGYGDFSPNEDLRLLFAGEALIGYVFFASIIGIMMALILKDETR